MMRVSPSCDSPRPATVAAAAAAVRAYLEQDACLPAAQPSGRAMAWRTAAWQPMRDAAFPFRRSWRGRD